MLRGIFGLKAQEVPGNWRKLHTVKRGGSSFVKGKVIPLHAVEALGVRGGIAPTHS
jgi:hypothetical protein